VANHTKNKANKKLVLGLKQAKENRRCFALVHTKLKPQTSGLTHLLLPDPENPQTWKRLTDIPTLDQHLIDYSQTHFKQAKGTP